MKSSISRRKALTGLGAMAGLSAFPLSLAAKEKSAKKKKSPFSYCLNTSTIMGQKLPIDEEIKVAAKAGYDGIEIWIRSLEAFVEKGGKLTDLKKLIDDQGIKVEMPLGLPNGL